jgi:hypothetical protein
METKWIVLLGVWGWIIVVLGIIVAAWLFSKELKTFKTIIETPKLYRTFYRDFEDTGFVIGDALSFGAVTDIENNGSTDTAIMESGPIRCLEGDTSAIILPENKKWSCTLTVEGATERGSMILRPYFYDITGLRGENLEKGAKMRVEAAGASFQGSFNSTQSISFGFSSSDPSRRVMRIKYQFVDETSPRTIRFFSLSIREM